MFFSTRGRDIYRNLLGMNLRIQERINNIFPSYECGKWIVISPIILETITSLFDFLSNTVMDKDTSFLMFPKIDE